MSETPEPNDEDMQVLQAFMHEIPAMHARFVLHMKNWDLWDLLPKEDQEFVNEMGLLITKLNDSKENKK